MSTLKYRIISAILFLYVFSLKGRNTSHFPSMMGPWRITFLPVEGITRYRRRPTCGRDSKKFKTHATNYRSNLKFIIDYMRNLFLLLGPHTYPTYFRSFFKFEKETLFHARTFPLHSLQRITLFQSFCSSQTEPSLGAFVSCPSLQLPSLPLHLHLPPYFLRSSWALFW